MTLSNGEFMSEKLPDLSHLTLAAREVAMLPDDQRISYVRFAAAGRIVCMAE
jgi:hypothetical protein